jgi:hypothetical protein
VEVGDEDGVDVIGVDGCSLECDQRRCAAIDEATESLGLQEDASLEAASGSEGITAS